jgi:hypothetical protein
MKPTTYSMRVPDQFNCLQQIIAHLGGMMHAFVRHYPINWAFHWRGICRAVLPQAALPEQERNSIARWRRTSWIFLP